ncbi:MAG TPA: hypothetical protein VMI33_22330 [Streptosporangiaceae bacterium]|nr:hypothetical protein [Streptosporangiaceae bacterium]
MNAIVAILLLGTATLAAAGLTILTLVITAIHSEERRDSLSEQPATYAETFARKIMGVHVSQPDARRTLDVPARRHRAKQSPAVPPRGPEPAPATQLLPVTRDERATTGDHTLTCGNWLIGANGIDQ